MHFPIIDLAPTVSGDPECMTATAREIEEALSSIGFLAIVGHGLDETITQAAWNSTREFFDLPLEEKLRSQSDDPDFPYGYAPMKGEALGEDAIPDTKESFSLGPPPRPEVEAAGGYRLAERLWPITPSTLKVAWLAYYGAMEALSTRLMRLFAIGLELDQDFFDDKIDRHISALRALNYPEQPAGGGRGGIRAGAHTDYGGLTILLPDASTAGLEVLTTSGDWLAVPKVPGGFVVNIGDLMAMWTNDRWRSTIHRVVGTGDGARRQSMAFFHQPNWDAPVECLPSCTDAGNPPAYTPTQSGPWLRARVEAARKI